MKLCLICNFQTAGEQEICPRDGSSMVTVGDDPLLGVVVEGRYKIDSVIGQGSAGTVYKAVQELIGREVAIKVLHDYLVSDQEFIKRFTQEAKASSRLSHPNIITIYDFGVIPQGGRPYIAMDLLRGTPLSDLLGERNHLDMDEAIPIFKQVCSALAEAHRQGVVHRDIKPENIVLVERSGQKLFPIVVDFGIARLVQEESDVARITRTGTVCGSPTYMSPEQCTSSKVDHRSDIYSLGVVIYETLTGEVPFLSDELVKVMAMHLSDPPKPLNQVREDLQFPHALEEVVYKSLAKNPDQRYQTMEEFAQALEESIKPSDSPQAPVAPPVVVKRPDMQPGPLAQDDDLAARKHTKEVAAPQVRPLGSKMDLASRALEELRNSGAYDENDPARVSQKMAAIAAAARAQGGDNGGGSPTGAMSSAQAQQMSRSSKFSKGRGKRSFFDKLPEMFQKLLVLVLVLGVCVGVVGYFGQGDPRVQHILSTVLPWKSAPVDADELVRQGKWEEALSVLRGMKQQGPLTKPQTETFGKVLVTVAKQRAKDKRYDDAIALLDQVPPTTAAKKERDLLLKRYKKIQDQNH